MNNVRLSAVRRVSVTHCPVMPVGPGTRPAFDRHTPTPRFWAPNRGRYLPT